MNLELLFGPFKSHINFETSKRKGWILPLVLEDSNQRGETREKHSQTLKMKPTGCSRKGSSADELGILALNSRGLMTFFQEVFKAKVVPLRLKIVQNK